MINIYQKNGNTVVISSRDEEGKRVFKNITHTPYFFILDKNGKYESIFGDTLKKIETKSSYEVGVLRDNYKKSFESDILFPNRVLIDCIPIPIKKAPIRIMYWDIENAGSFDCRNTPVSITCICTYDSFTKRQVGFAWREDLKKKVEKDKKRSVYYFNTEEEMLKNFIQYIVDFDFDLFCGWYTGGFDFPYLYNRCKKLGIKEIDSISMHRYVKCKNRYGDIWDIDIKGRYNFDVLKGYRGLTFHELKSYHLNDIAIKELQDEKIKHEEEWEDFWKSNLPKLIEYCFQDVTLCVRIDEKRGITNHYDTMRRNIGCQWSDIWNTTRYHDILFLREARRKGRILPRKVKNKRESFGGGFVGEAVPGLHKNVIVIDLKSMYPNLINTFNLSPETLNPEGNIRINGHAFVEDKKGICSIIGNKLLKKRFEIKDKMKMVKEKYGSDYPEFKKLYAEQYAVKVVVLSLWGALGNPYFRMYRREVADTITFGGRNLIHWSRQKTRELGYEVVYTDTDSVFFKVAEDKTPDECKKIGEEVSKKITDSYDEYVKQYGITKHTLEMCYEKTFTEVFFGIKESGKSVKKRYAGYVLEKGKKKFKSKGFETVRSDTAKTEQEVLENVFKIILDGKSKDEVLNYVDKVKKDMKNGKYEYSEIAIRRGIKKLNRKDIYTEALRYGNKHLGCRFESGSKIKLLFVTRMPKGYPHPTKGTIAFEKEEQVPKGVVIDWRNLFRRLFDTKLERIFRAMGWSGSKKNNMVRLDEF